MAGNPNYPAVALQLHFDGANGSTSFPDSGPGARTVTRVGTAITISTAWSAFGGASASFTGASGNYLRVNHASVFSPSTKAWTLECRVRPSSGSIASTNGKGLVTKRSDLNENEWALRIVTADGKTSFQMLTWSVGGTGGIVAVNLIGNTAIVANGEYAVAVTRSATGYWRLFVNGNIDAQGQETASAQVLTNVQVFIGSDAIHYTDRFYVGYMDDLRITDGVCLYDAAYTPSAEAFPDFAGRVSGTVTNSEGEFAQRVVRAYRRDTGTLVYDGVSDPVTGEFGFNTLTLDELSVICLDDASGSLQNDRVLRVIPA